MVHLCSNACQPKYNETRVICSSHTKSQLINRRSKLRTEELRRSKLRKEKVRRSKLRKEKVRRSKLRTEKVRRSKLRTENVRRSKLRSGGVRRSKLRTEEVRFFNDPQHRLQRKCGQKREPSLTNKSPRHIRARCKKHHQEG
jgi:hypothetical protein